MLRSCWTSASCSKLTVGAMLVAGCIGGALACGPRFPWSLLEDRDGTAVTMVELSFPFEASRLVPAPKDRLQAVESYDPIVEWAGNPSDEPEVVAVEQEEARSGVWRAMMSAHIDPGTLAAKLTAARKATDGEAVLSAGAGLPDAVLSYIAGAVEFRADRLDTAMRYFEAIERLPLEQRDIRAVAAAYMRGRVLQRLGRLVEARAAFQVARRYGQAEAPDPMGLAVASLGEEARTYLVEAGLVRVSWPVPAEDVDDAKFATLTIGAVRLYADQAARGSKMALLSLHEVAKRLAARERSLMAVAADPLVRRLLVAYAVERFEDHWSDGPRFEDIERIIDAMASRAAPRADEDLDRLAALAYRGGRYEVAEHLVSQTTRPLGLWVRAKLALMRNDRSAAIHDWIAAVRGMEQAGAAVTLDEGARTRLRGQAAIVRLSQGEYSDSLRLLFPVAAEYWGDVTYIAERVMTVDELRAFVDGLPLPPSPRMPESMDDYVFWSLDFVPSNRLRLLLARRLVREGRLKEAVAYFPPAELLAMPDKRNATAEEARDYLAAVELVRRPGWPFDWPWQRVARAEALFKVATLERRRGMQLMGTEGVPDQAGIDGAFSYGLGMSRPWPWEDSKSELLGPDEEKRFAASAPKPNVRFHYRVIATDRASAAADLLPKRSQAYAATLCWAARFAIDSGDQARADAIYRRYVANGAYQAWAKNFGWTCPAPDFDGARTFWLRRANDWMARTVDSVWRRTGLAISVLIATASLAVFIRRRRARQ